MTIVLLATLTLILFSAIAAADAVYFHIIKYKLYARKESRYEHKLHTFNAVLFPFTGLFLFAENFGGAALWAGFILTVVTFGLEGLVVACEKDSRRNIGGLTTLEYGLHMAMVGLRVAFTALIFAQKPVSAWTQAEVFLIPNYTDFTRSVGGCVFLSGLVMAAWHIVLLYWRPSAKLST